MGDLLFFGKRPFLIDMNGGPEAPPLPPGVLEAYLAFVGSIPGRPDIDVVAITHPDYEDDDA